MLHLMIFSRHFDQNVCYSKKVMIIIPGLKNIFNANGQYFTIVNYYQISHFQLTFFKGYASTITAGLSFLSREVNVNESLGSKISLILCIWRRKMTFDRFL